MKAVVECKVRDRYFQKLGRSAGWHARKRAHPIAKDTALQFYTTGKCKWEKGKQAEPGLALPTSWRKLVLLMPTHMLEGQTGRARRGVKRRRQVNT